jgi:hypothetical protein
MVRHDRALNRLYVFAAPPLQGNELLSNLNLYIYDLSNPALPTLLTPEPHSVPVTSSVAIDPIRQILFVFANNSSTNAKSLHVFDLLSSTLEEVPGSPLDMKAYLPQSNNTSMTLRGLIVLEDEHRLYAARSQGANSELVVLEYPAALPTTTQRYGQLANMANTVLIPDFFDIDVPVQDRPNLLDAFSPRIDRQLRAIFFPVNAWATAVSFSHAMVVPMTSQLQPAPACGDFEGFGCFYRGYVGGAPIGYAATDEASCVNSTHRIYVGSSYDLYNEMDPGTMHVYSYDTNLSMTPFLETDGSNASAGGLPINAICH